MDDKRFRVVIVGAGPIGLYMAHTMERANIDYVLLERQPTVLSPAGQLLFTWPQTVRLIDQIGLYDDVKDVAVPIHYKKRVYGCDGRVTSINRFWDVMQTNHGYPLLPILRGDLVKILYSRLKGKDTNVQTSAEVTDIQTHADGVHVCLADGRTVDGSVVIGADGVHSMTRTLMRKLARDDFGSVKLEDDDSDDDDDNDDDNDSDDVAMASEFYGIFGQASVGDLAIEPEVFFESRGAGAVIQCLQTADGLRFVTLKRLPLSAKGELTTKTKTKIKTRYTRAEMEAYAASIGDVAVCPGVRFRDVWARANKDAARMLDQEEGFMRRWHWRGRVVLVGDAAHKSTSVNGLGMTCGLHSAAVLANLLQGLVAAKPDPDASALDAVFAHYQRDRQREVKPVWDGGYAMVREVTRKSWASWFWDSYILPWIDAERVAQGFVPSMFLVRYGQTLSYVPFVGEHGKVPWVRRPVV